VAVRRRPRPCEFPVTPTSRLSLGAILTRNAELNWRARLRIPPAASCSGLAIISSYSACRVVCGIIALELGETTGLHIKIAENSRPRRHVTCRKSNPNILGV